MTRALMKVAAWNLGLLAVVVLPSCFLLIWLQALLNGGSAARSLAYAAETGAFYYLVYIPGVLLGGVVHQAVLLFLSPSWPPRASRWLTMATGLVIPFAVIALGERPGTVLDFGLPVVVALGLYGTTLRMPRDRSAAA